MKAVIFDMDNTLVATQEFFISHLMESLHVLGKAPVTKGSVLKILKLNLSFEDNFIELFGSEGKEVLSEYRRTAQERPFSPTRGALEYQSQLKKFGLYQGIVTNRVTMAEFRLKQAGFGEFDFILSPKHKKPDPRALEEALLWLKDKGVSKGEVLFIGDHTDDFKASRDAGVAFCAVLTGAMGEKDFVKEGLPKSQIFKNLGEIHRGR